MSSIYSMKSNLCSFLFFFLSAFSIFPKYFVCLPCFQIYWNTADHSSLCSHVLRSSHNLLIVGFFFNVSTSGFVLFGYSYHSFSDCSCRKHWAKAYRTMAWTHNEEKEEKEIDLLEIIRHFFMFFLISIKWGPFSQWWCLLLQVKQKEAIHFPIGAS